MDVGLGWSNRQMLTKKLPVHTTLCVIEHPSLGRGKISTKPDITSSCFAVAINCFLNGFVSFLSSKRITVPHLNGKMTFVKGCQYLRHSDWQKAHVVQEWDEVVRIVLPMMRKRPFAPSHRHSMGFPPHVFGSWGLR